MWSTLKKRNLGCHLKVQPGYCGVWAGASLTCRAWRKLPQSRGGQGISRHALCTDSHLAAPLENGLHLHAYNLEHTLAHNLVHTLAHTQRLVPRYLLLLLRRKFGVIREVSAPPAFLQFPINILRHPLCTTTTIFLQLPTTRFDLPIGVVIIVVTLREEICGEGEAVASP